MSRDHSCERGGLPHGEAHLLGAKAGHACAVAGWATEAQRNNATN